MPRGRVRYRHPPGDRPRRRQPARLRRRRHPLLPRRPARVPRCAAARGARDGRFHQRSAGARRKPGRLGHLPARIEHRPGPGQPLARARRGRMLRRLPRGRRSSLEPPCHRVGHTGPAAVRGDGSRRRPLGARARSGQTGAARDGRQPRRRRSEPPRHRGPARARGRVPGAPVLPPHRNHRTRRREGRLRPARTPRSRPAVLLRDGASPGRCDPRGQPERRLVAGGTGGDGRAVVARPLPRRGRRPPIVQRRRLHLHGRGRDARPRPHDAGTADRSGRRPPRRHRAPRGDGRRRDPSARAGRGVLDRRTDPGAHLPVPLARPFAPGAGEAPGIRPPKEAAA